MCMARISWSLRSLAKCGRCDASLFRILGAYTLNHLLAGLSDGFLSKASHAFCPISSIYNSRCRKAYMRGEGLLPSHGLLRVVGNLDELNDITISRSVS